MTVKVTIIDEGRAPVVVQTLLKQGPFREEENKTAKVVVKLIKLILKRL